MGEEKLMRTHHRPNFDDMRAQMRSAPASLHSNCQEFHSRPLGDSKENARTSRSNIGISKNRSLRPKFHALKAISDVASRPSDWHDLPVRNPGELRKADALRGSMSARGALYPLPCNSQTITQVQTPRAIRVPSKLDALRKQMASAPGARIGPGNLHSYCYEYLYQREGSYKPPKLDEKALRLIDEKLEAADTLGPCYFGQGLLRPKARYSRSAQDTSCTGKQDIQSRMHHRRSSYTGDMKSAAAAGHGTHFALGSQSRGVLEEFHPKNYRLRSDIDTLRRKQRSAPSSTVNMESCSCQCASEKTQKPSKKSVNFTELKDKLKSRYEFRGQEVLVPFTARSSSTSLRPAAKAEGGPRDRECTSPRHCYTRRCEPSRKCDEVIAYNSRSSGTAAAAAPTPASAPASAPVPVHASAVGHGCSSQPETRFREELPLYSGDLLALSEDLEASQVKDERLDKSLQRQKMMLRLIRRNKQKSCSYLDLQAPPRPRPRLNTRMLLQR